MSKRYFVFRRGFTLGVVTLLTSKVVSLHIVSQTVSKINQEQLQSSVAALFISVVLAGSLYGLLSGMTMIQTTPTAGMSDDDVSVQYLWTLARVFYFSVLTAAGIYLVFSRLHLNSFPQSLLWYWTYGFFGLSTYQLLYRLGAFLRSNRLLGATCLAILALLNLGYCVYELYFGFENSGVIRVFSPSASMGPAVMLDGASVVMLLTLRLFPNANGAGAKVILGCERLYGRNLAFPWSEGMLVPSEVVGSSRVLIGLLGEVKKPFRSLVVLSLSASSNLALRTVVTVSLMVATIATGAVAFGTHQGVFYLVPTTLSYLGAQVYLWSYRSFTQRETLRFRFAFDVGKLERKVTLVLGLIYLVLFWILEAILLLPVIGTYSYMVVGALTIAVSLGSIFASVIFIVTYSRTYLDITWARGKASGDAIRSVLRQALILLVASTGDVSLVQFHALGTTRSFLFETIISVVAFSLILPLAASAWIGRREYGLQRATTEPTS